MTFRIVVGVDDSEAGRAALVWAMEEAVLLGATVTAVNVWSHEPLSDFAFTTVDAVREASEKLLDDDLCGPVSAHMQSLSMLVCTEGRERSLAQYGDLLKAAGFSGVTGHRTGSTLDGVLARKE